MGSVHIQELLDSEKTQIQLRGEFYNAFNHAQWSTINSAAKFNAAGQQINTLFGRATANRGPRVIQLAEG